MNDRGLDFVHLTVNVPHGDNCDDECESEHDIADDFAFFVLSTYMTDGNISGGRGQ